MGNILNQKETTMKNQKQQILPKYDPEKYNSWSAWYLEYKTKLMKI